MTTKNFYALSDNPFRVVGYNIYRFFALGGKVLLLAEGENYYSYDTPTGKLKIIQEENFQYFAEKLPEDQERVHANRYFYRDEVIKISWAIDDHEGEYDDHDFHLVTAFPLIKTSKKVSVPKIILEKILTPAPKLSPVVVRLTRFHHPGIEYRVEI